MAQRKHRDNLTEEPRTLVQIVRDKSASMRVRSSATVTSTEEYVDTLKHDAKGQVYLTLTEFDSTVHQRFTMVPLESVSRHDLSNYWPSGMTALYDAIARTMQDIEHHERRDDRVVFVIITDGEENSSRNHGRSEIQEMIANRERDGWEFIYLGAGKGSWAGGERLGLRNDQTIYYGEDPHSHRHAMATAARATVTATKHARGAGAGYMFLASSPVKSSLESQAGSRPNVPPTAPADPQTPSSPNPNRSVSNQYRSNLRERARKQRRDANGRFIKS